MGIILSSSAFAPAHITGFFKIYKDGSTGAGINPSKGAETKVIISDQKPGVKICINNIVEKPASVSEYVIQEFLSINKNLAPSFIEVQHQLAYPVGYGMGMSGAGAFSLALALNKVSCSDLTYDECMYVAMRAEIKAGTGLGDVIAQKYYGLMIGLPPFPSRNVEIIACAQKYISCGFFAPISTSEIIRDSGWKDKINAAGSECMQELEKNKSAENFIKICRHFTFETGLASKEVRNVMEKIPSSSMAMLGQSVFILTDSEDEAIRILRPYCKDIKVSTISTEGAHVIE